MISRDCDVLVAMLVERGGEELQTHGPDNGGALRAFSRRRALDPAAGILSERFQNRADGSRSKQLLHAGVVLALRVALEAGDDTVRLRLC